MCIRDRSVANELVLAGNPAPAAIDTKAEVTFQPGKGITGSRLTVTAVVPEIDAETFQAAVAAAEKNCPVSNALAATPITVEASLAE